MAYTVHSVVPEHLEPPQSTLNTAELTALLNTSDLRYLVLSGASASYVRRVAKAARTEFKVTEKGATLVVERLVSPRGLTTLEKVDELISYHALRIGELVKDREKVRQAAAREAARLAQAVPLDDPPDSCVAPDSANAFTAAQQSGALKSTTDHANPWQAITGGA